MNNHDLQLWIAHALQVEGLPDLLDELRGKIENLTPAALAVGDTDCEKTQIATLRDVIYMIENFHEYIADTETETGDNA